MYRLYKNRAEAATLPSALPRAAARRQAKDTLRQPCDKEDRRGEELSPPRPVCQSCII